MLFNSFEFLLFFAVVFLLYWSIFQKNLKTQNLFILVTSYVFYAWWDWRFLSLIIFSSIVDFICGLKISKAKEITNKKILLGISIGLNLILLGFFKYYNFFIESTIELLQEIGLQANIHTIQIILPVGISFYTFQTMSYTIDVYRGKINATINPIPFFSYVAFFPQLVAGPIERASNLLPQFFKNRTLDFMLMRTSLRIILWGFFKKMVIADNCAPFVDKIFNNYSGLDTLMLSLGIVFFAFQLYGDFSGYTDIARGTAGLLGFYIKPNFKTPYFSRDISEYWRNWHISLYSWFKDYLYIPLGGSEGSKWHWFRNVSIVFLLGSLWHGANWTFIVWGLINIVYFLPILIFGGMKYYTKMAGGNNLIPTTKEIFQIALTFSLTCISRIYFRSETVNDGNLYITGFFTNWGFDWSMIELKVFMLMLLIILFFVVEWIGRNYENTLEGILLKLPVLGRWSIYYILVGMILLIGGRPQEFYYFQF